MFQKLLKKLKTVLKLPLREKIWLFLFYPYSGLLRAAILLLPFKWLSRFYGVYYQNTQLSPLVSAKEQMTAWRLGRIAEMTAKYTPWESKCLVQALMVKTVLNYYRIPYVMHLGARLTEDPKEPMKAHAWVKVGRWIVAGGEGHRAYGLTATFVSPSLKNIVH